MFHGAQSLPRTVNSGPSFFSNFGCTKITALIIERINKNFHLIGGYYGNHAYSYGPDN